MKEINKDLATTSEGQSGDELPPLPEAFGQIEIYGDEDCAVRVRSVDGFTADQMRDYARAAVSAATKPTADLSKLTRFEVQRDYIGDGEYSLALLEAAEGEFCRFADVQSLLATKPAAPADDKHVPGWERGIATVTLSGHQLRMALDLINPDGPSDDLQMDDELTFGIVQHKDDAGTVSTGMCCWNGDTDGVLPLDGEYTATPAASTTGAAQTAEQVRDAALEEAAQVAEAQNRVGYEWVPNSLWDNIIKRVPPAIRALKRPTPTHSSEAGE